MLLLLVRRCFFLFRLEWDIGVKLNWYDFFTADKMRLKKIWKIKYEIMPLMAFWCAFFKIICADIKYYSMDMRLCSFSDDIFNNCAPNHAYKWIINNSYVQFRQRLNAIFEMIEHNIAYIFNLYVKLMRFTIQHRI